MKKCVNAVVWGLLSFGLVSLPMAPVGAAGQVVVQGVSDYENHQYKADIDWALKNGIMGKFPDGFKPDEPVTQAHFLGAFANLYKLKEATPMPEMGN
ncbi:MAG: S-layer homology domain-containing protein, partial [Clostridia bacterium]